MNPLVQPDPGLFIWTILTFLVLAGLLAKFAWRPLLDALERRQSAIAKSLDDAQKARQELERLQQEQAKMMAAARAEAEAIVARSRADAEALREELKQNLKTEGDYVIVNYFRPALGQQGGGHISPLAAYDAKSDSFLVMDVNSTDQRWVWVKASALFASMRTPDVQENRGYLLVKEGQPAQARETP